MRKLTLKPARFSEGLTIHHNRPVKQWRQLYWLHFAISLGRRDRLCRSFTWNTLLRKSCRLLEFDLILGIVRHVLPNGENIYSGAPGLRALLVRRLLQDLGPAPKTRRQW
jgi:hypothetical protein